MDIKDFWNKLVGNENTQRTNLTAVEGLMTRPPETPYKGSRSSVYETFGQEGMIPKLRDPNKVNMYNSDVAAYGLSSKEIKAVLDGTSNFSQTKQELIRQEYEAAKGYHDALLQGQMGYIADRGPKEHMARLQEYHDQIYFDIAHVDEHETVLWIRRERQIAEAYFNERALDVHEKGFGFFASEDEVHPDSYLTLFEQASIDRQASLDIQEQLRTAIPAAEAELKKIEASDTVAMDRYLDTYHWNFMQHMEGSEGPNYDKLVDYFSGNGKVFADGTNLHEGGSYKGYWTELIYNRGSLSEMATKTPGNNWFNQDLFDNVLSKKRNFDKPTLNELTFDDAYEGMQTAAARKMLKSGERGVHTILDSEDFQQLIADYKDGFESLLPEEAQEKLQTRITDLEAEFKEHLKVRIDADIGWQKTGRDQGYMTIKGMHFEEYQKVNPESYDRLSYTWDRMYSYSDGIHAETVAARLAYRITFGENPDVAVAEEPESENHSPLIPIAAGDFVQGVDIDEEYLPIRGNTIQIPSGRFDVLKN